MQSFWDVLYMQKHIWFITHQSKSGFPNISKKFPTFLFTNNDYKYCQGILGLYQVFNVGQQEVKHFVLISVVPESALKKK